MEVNKLSQLQHRKMKRWKHNSLRDVGKTVASIQSTREKNREWRKEILNRKSRLITSKPIESVVRKLFKKRKPQDQMASLANSAKCLSKN